MIGSLSNKLGTHRERYVRTHKAPVASDGWGLEWCAVQLLVYMLKSVIIQLERKQNQKKTLFLSLFSLSWSLEDLLYSLALAYLFIFFLLLLVNNWDESQSSPRLSSKCHPSCLSRGPFKHIHTKHGRENFEIWWERETRESQTANSCWDLRDWLTAGSSSAAHDSDVVVVVVV